MSAAQPSDGRPAPQGLRRRDCLAGAVAAVCADTSRAQGNPWPHRAVRLVIPNAPGSSVDTIGRLLGAGLAPLLGQAVVVDNRAGAAGAVGMDAVRHAAPDGYTLALASSSSTTVAPLLQKAVSYEPLRDFEFVSLVAVLPNVLVCHPGLGVSNLAEFIAQAKAQPGRWHMASAGPGSVSHLAGAALCHAAGIDSLHVPYKGGSQSVGSVVAGESQWTLTPAPAAMGLVKGGRLRALGHSGAAATAPLGPGIAALADTLPGFEFVGWIGVLAPRGVADAAAQALRRATAAALSQATVREAFAAQGAVAQGLEASAFRDFVARDIDITRRAIRSAGIQAE